MTNHLPSPIKGITNANTFLINKMGGWKHTSVFPKKPKINRHQTLKTL